MIALLVSSKSMDFETPLSSAVPAPTEPVFREEAVRLNTALGKLDEGALRALMGISESLASQTRERIQRFSAKPPAGMERPACLTFSGDVYDGLEAGGWKRRELQYAQNHLRILSGLYGVLRPLDAIQPYRLEPGYRWSPEPGCPSLPVYWKGRVTSHLAESLAALPAAQRRLVDLASKEFTAMVDFSELGVPVIRPHFQEVKGGKRRTVALFTKRARGAMARWIVTRRWRDPEFLKTFDEGGYRFEPSVSDETAWYFLR